MDYQYPNYTSYQDYSEPTPPPAKTSLVRRTVGIVAFAVVLEILLTSVVQVIAHNFVLGNYPAIAENDWYLWALSGLPMYLVAMPVAYILLCFIPKSAPQKQKLNPLMWFGFLFLCFALSYASNFLGQFISTWFSNLTGIQVENELQEMTSVTPFGINLLFVGIIAPIFEELFFRKAIIDRLRRYGDLPAVLISGLIFGLVHGNLNQIFYTVTVGMLLSFIYVRTGSVLYTISIHAAFNLIGGVYTTELIRRLGEDLMPIEGDAVGQVMLLAYSLFTVLSLVVGIIFFLANIKRFHHSLQKGEAVLTLDKWMNAVTLNPGVWVLAIIVVAMVVSNLLV